MSVNFAIEECKLDQCRVSILRGQPKQSFQVRFMHFTKLINVYNWSKEVLYKEEIFRFYRMRKLHSLVETFSVISPPIRNFRPEGGTLSFIAMVQAQPFITDPSTRICVHSGGSHPECH